MLVVLAIIQQPNGKILIGRIPKRKLKGFGEETAKMPYVFPGGDIDPEEDIERSLKNVVKRSTGLDLVEVRLIGKRIHPITEKDIIYFYCKPALTGMYTEQKDSIHIENLQWVTVDDLKKKMPSIFDEVIKYLENNNTYRLLF